MDTQLKELERIVYTNTLSNIGLQGYHHSGDIFHVVEDEPRIPNFFYLIEEKNKMLRVSLKFEDLSYLTLLLG